MRIVFTQAARKHRIGRESVRYVMATTAPEPVITKVGDEGWKYVGADERGRELEVVAVELDDETLLVIHVMPTIYRT